MTPQLILTLAPSGTLQAELPGPNGSRRVIPLEGTGENIIASLIRMLAGQRQGFNKVGEAGAPTAQEVQHYLQHNSPSAGCPFCDLGLKHSQQYCNNSPSSLKKASRKVSKKFSQQLANAYPLPCNPTELGI